MACSADAPTKTNSNGKVLARLRSTASTNLISQAPGSLARSSSSLSRDLQLPASGSGTVPSIGRLGSIAAGPPQLNKLAPAVGRGAARRSADLPLQQLMGMQTPGVCVRVCVCVCRAHLLFLHASAVTPVVADGECLMRQAHLGQQYRLQDVKQEQGGSSSSSVCRSIA